MPWQDKSVLIKAQWCSAREIPSRALQRNRTRFPIDVIVVCIRWYAAYPLSYRHLKEIDAGARRSGRPLVD